MDQRPINDILIVGGGTAGWLTAAYLARKLGADRPDGVRITLIESSEIGIIGVGEGTIPTIRATMREIGIDEAQFMRGAGAAFKQGIKFVDWVDAPVDGAHSHYYHPFTRPHALGGMDLAPYWLMGCAGGKSYAEAVTLQESICEAGKGPKLIDDPEYSSPLGYAYHFDAAKLAVLMREAAKALGVRHLLGNVNGARLDETGAIAAVVTREHGELTAGLYIDCSGFSAKLIGEAMGVPFVDDSDVLFVNRAVAIQVLYERPDASVAASTISTAHEAGWTWDIGLPDRRGVGYVYSNHHTSDDRAEEVLRAYIGPAAEGLDARQLKLPIGHRKTPWVKNCVAVGLSAGFLEPLEATGIMLIEAAAWMLGRLFPRSGDLETTAALFNEAMGLRYKGVLDFIKLHYCLSRRTDNDFWIDNTRRESIPDSLLDRLEMWKTRGPDPFDFGTVHDSFEVFNYQYVLYGMGFKSDLSANLSAYPHLDAARREFARIENAAARAAAAMPDHRALLAEIYRNGFRRPAPHGAAAR
ncbi:MAG: tryptophan 7-halogenase [Caulobacter sp.]|nr:tryptophan 7-halogenase [Caulobacter sp.]